MIENRVIDGKIELRDLLAQAICIGAKAGRGQIDYSSKGPWRLADDILQETEEVLKHRESILGIRAMIPELVKNLETFEK